ncbi:MAG: DEAD/DEAH box helicase, partial [Proteobacteria bacterium]|nr:DEAD/DEAH box helicase [Pseudomonadota bacterium]
SGKTIVALAAALDAAECKVQTAFMAPTDTLAQQHYAKIKPICDKIGVVCDILTGRDKGAAQKEKLISIRSGRTQIIIGTHALFQDAVVYKDLGLVIIDEQHRFGVAQRSALTAKGNNPDLLALSATPIPRTLSMTIYGDMDISVIAEKPHGRVPIKTSMLPVHRINALVQRLSVQISGGEATRSPDVSPEALAKGEGAKGGAKVFWVCPLVSESEDMPFAAAESRYEWLKKYFQSHSEINCSPLGGSPSVARVGGQSISDRPPTDAQNSASTPPRGGVVKPPDIVGIVHGQMDKKERDKIMSEFSDPHGKIKLLVATSVIEVGIDVPSATIMIIENAEKFGLSALHQLRGRVGRGDAQSFCILLHGDHLSESGAKRLNVLCTTDDGFVIAEQDLMMRGAGELLGMRQSGWTMYHFVDYAAHRDLFKLATRAALELTESDPHLESSAGRIAREWMFIFDRESELKG